MIFPTGMDLLLLLLLLGVWEGLYFLFKNSILNLARELVDHRIYTRTPGLNRECHVFGVRDTVEAAKLFTLHHNDLWLLPSRTGVWDKSFVLTTPGFVVCGLQYICIYITEICSITP